MIAQLRRYSSTVLGAAAILIGYSLLWSLVRGQFSLASWIILGLGLVTLAVYVALEPAQVRTALTGRTARGGANAGLVTLAVLGILVLANLLAARHYKRFDLTEGRQLTLSPQTRQVLAALKEPVDVVAFMTPSYYDRARVQNLLQEYSLHTAKLNIQYIDPDQQPMAAYQLGFQPGSADGAVIFLRGNQRQLALGADEQEFTSALVKLTRTETKTVYFLTGHGERGSQDGGQNGYQLLANALPREGYTVAVLNLMTTPAVPSDAALLILAQPMVAPSAEEMAAINAFVDRGGSLFVLADPASEVTLDELLGRWGLNLRHDLVVDPKQALGGTQLETPVVLDYPYHTITKNLSSHKGGMQGVASAFPGSRSIAIAQPAPAGAQATAFVQSSAQSWGETDLQSQQRPQLDAGKDTAGPLNLAVAATLDLPVQAGESEAKRARLVVFGDADFAGNSFLQAYASGNGDLFLNAVNWLAEDESLITIRPNPPAQRMIMLTGTTERLVMLTSMLFIPAAVVAAGVWVWWKRR